MTTLAQPTLTTERLILRPLTLADAATVHELAGAYDIAKTTLNIPHPYPDGGAQAWIESTWAAAEKGRAYTFAISDGSQQLFGSIGLGIDKLHNKAEIAYWVGTPFWGKGYTTEVARRLLEFGFDELGLHRIFAFAFTGNPASSRVMQKIGMKYEGTLRQHVCKWGEYEDLDTYGILRSEYANANAK